MPRDWPLAGIDPAQSPQIRVPVLMKEAMVPDWGWVHMDDRRARWVQVFARLKPGYTVESAQAPLQGLFTQIREYEMTLPAAKDWSTYSREQFMKGRLQVAAADLGFSLAGVYGALTVNRRILVVQAAPAIVALAVVLLAG